MPTSRRLSTGIAGLDERLGGGLLPGTLTVVAGATGVGKTQLGVHFAAAGNNSEPRRGVFCDLATRGDAQGHAAYAARIAGWSLATATTDAPAAAAELFAADPAWPDYLHAWDYSGRRVTRGSVSPEVWQDWNAELARKLAVCIGFFYGAFLRGARRVVVDGLEPCENPADSVQFELFEYVYHQILRKEHDWVARDLLREQFRAHADQVAAQPYECRDVACLLLLTTKEILLSDLIARSLAEGDVLANANTVLYLGRQPQGDRVGRALYIAKHRGSACSEEIVPYTIDERGWRLL